MVYEDADATLLRLFECFMESAPQLVLQVKRLFVADLSAFFLSKKSKNYVSFFQPNGIFHFQIYILIKDPHASRILDDDALVEGNNLAADNFVRYLDLSFCFFFLETIETTVIIKSTILVISVVSSLISLAWSLVVYHRSLR